MVFSRLLTYLKPHRSKLLLTFAVLLVATAGDVAGPMLAKVFIDDYLEPGLLIWPDLGFLAGAYIGLVILSAVLNYWQMVSFNTIALKIVHQLRVDVFGKVQYLALSVFDKTPVGSLVSRITNDTEAVKELFVSVLSTFAQNIVFLVGIFIAMFALDVRLATFCLILAPAVFTLMQLYRRFSTRIYRAQRKLLSKINAKLNESIQGMSIIQAMGQEKKQRQEFALLNQDFYHKGRVNIKLNAILVRPAVDMLHVLTLTLVLSFFGIDALNGPIEIGVLYAYISYIDRFFEPINTMMSRLSQLQQAVVSAERVFEIMDDDRTAPCHPWHRGISPSMDKSAPCHQPKINTGLVEFENVSFSYDGQTEVLKNASFTVHPGQTVALVGHTGSGKSTIANLLLRFYPLDQGEIRIDGVPLSAFAESELRTKVGLVLQEPFLFVGDIRSNIALGRVELSDQQVEDGARLVQADQFISKLPQGYGEPLGERGATLSGGQRQLICFARTMAGSPKILVMDEATASVDTETEEAIQTALDNMRTGRTTIVIAHRLSTIQDADLILVLHHGQIVERGTHQQLLATQGLYYKMYKMQQGA